jgi:hypothetical protein
MGRRALPPPPGGWEKAIGDAIQRLKQEKPSIRSFCDLGHNLACK